MDELLFFFLSFSAVKVEVKKNKSKGIEVRNKKKGPGGLGSYSIWFGFVEKLKK